MRKGAAESGWLILSSAIGITSTFADVAYFNVTQSSGVFILSLGL